jgi:hypothetical protein
MSHYRKRAQAPNRVWPVTRAIVAAWLAALGAAARDIAAQDLPTRLLHLLFALIRFVAEPSVLRRQLRDRETVSPEAALG